MKRIYFIIILLFTVSQIDCQNTDQKIVFSNSITLKSQILQEEREIRVYLPTNYDNTSRNYPILYVIDGQRYFLNGITFQQNLTWQGIIPEFIVVGINTDSQKRRNLFYKESTKFIRFLEEELIPKIDTKYRTLNQRIYFGWEMAAGLGVQIIAEKPSLFNGFLLSSPTHISKDRLQAINKMLKTDSIQNLKLYSVLGTVETWATKSMSTLDSIFRKNTSKNIQWKYNLSDKENHYTTPLTTINEGLIFFFNDYGPLRFYSVKEFTNFGGIEKLKDHYRRRRKKYQVSEEIHSDTKHYLLLQTHKEGYFEIFEDLINEIDGKKFIENYYRQPRWFNRFSKFYLYNNKSEEALEILDLGLKKFPNSSMLHFEKGNYFKAIGKNREVQKWYKKAIDIAKKNEEIELKKYTKELEKL